VDTERVDGWQLQRIFPRMANEVRDLQGQLNYMSWNHGQKAELKTSLILYHIAVRLPRGHC